MNIYFEFYGNFTRHTWKSLKVCTEIYSSSDRFHPFATFAIINAIEQQHCFWKSRLSHSAWISVKLMCNQFYYTLWTEPGSTLSSTKNSARHFTLVKTFSFQFGSAFLSSDQYKSSSIPVVMIKQLFRIRRSILNPNVEDRFRTNLRQKTFRILSKNQIRLITF